MRSRITSASGGPVGPRSRSGRRHRWLLAIGVVVVAVVAVLVLLAVNAPALANYVAGKAVPELSQKIGQKVAIGKVRARVLPLRVELDKVSVSPVEAGEPDLVDVNELAAKIRVWPFIRSLGKRIEVGEVDLDHPHVTLVRRADGTWNYEEVARRLEGTGAGSAPSRDVAIDGVYVRGGRVDVIDRSQRGKGAVGGGPRGEPRPSSRGETVGSIDRLDLTVRDIGSRRPMRVDANAAVASDKQNVTFHGSMASARSGEGSGRATGDLAISNARLGDFAQAFPAQLAAISDRALLSFRGKIASDPKGGEKLTGDGKVDRLSAGNTNLAATFALAARQGAAAGAPTDVDVSRFALRGAGIDVGGKASLRASRSARDVDFELSGPELDLDPILAASKGPKENPAPSNAAPVPSEMHIEDIGGKGKVDIAAVRAGKVTLRNVKGQGTLSRGVFSLDQADATLFGGRASLGGTQVDFNRSPAVWHLREKIDGLDIGDAAQDFFGSRFVDGKGSTQLQLSGTGTNWEQARDSINGTGSISLASGRLGFDLGERLARPLGDALQQVGLGANARAARGAEQTHIGALDAAFTVNQGWATLSSPLKLDTPIAKMSLTGRIRLDGQAELSGNADLDPSLLARMSPQLARQPLTVPVTLRGSLSNPEISVSIPPGDVARTILRNTLGR